MLDDIDLYVIHLIKDVRAYAISTLDVTERKYGAGRGLGARLPDAIKLRPVRIFWHWYRKNLEIQRFLDARKLKHYQVGYEEVCLSPGRTVAGLCEFLGIDYEPSMLDIGSSQSHAASGNRMRLQPGKRQAIMYDKRWFHRSEWVVPYALFPHIARYNTSNTYGNSTRTVWSR